MTIRENTREIRVEHGGRSALTPGSHAVIRAPETGARCASALLRTARSGLGRGEIVRRDLADVQLVPPLPGQAFYHVIKGIYV